MEDLVLLRDILGQQNGPVGREKFCKGCLGTLVLVWEDIKVGKIIGNLGMDKEIEKYLRVVGEQ